MKEKVYIENKFITIKKHENGSYFFDANTYLSSFIIVFILIFPIAILVSKDFLFSLIAVISMFIVINIVIFVNDYFGKKMHSKIFQKQIFQNLMVKGFRKEEIGKYEGLILEKNGRTIRVFYDWNKYAGGVLSFGDIVIDVFYEPQILLDDFEDANYVMLKLKKMKVLTNVYDKSFWSKSKRITFTLFNLQIYLNYYPWTSSEKIISKIEFGLKILEENNLKPFSINNIENPEFKILNDQNYFYPSMPHIWDYLEKTKKENKL